MRLGHDMEGCGNCIKYSLFIVNLLIFVVGLIVVILSGWIIADQSFANDLLGTNLFSGAAHILLITGIFVTVFAGLGCYGSVKEIRCMLVTYFIALFLITVTMFVGAILGYVFREKVETTLQNAMYTSLRFYGDPHYNYITRSWDETQSRLRCCGIRGPQDWGGIKIPESCCIPVGGKALCRMVEVQNSFTRYETGCYIVTKDFIKGHALIIGTAGVILSVLMVLAIVFSCALFRMIK